MCTCTRDRMCGTHQKRAVELLAFLADLRGGWAALAEEA